jgi:hypothetical protein
MSHRRALSVVLAAVAATMLVTGSFGFTSVSAERGVSVAVVDSENAYVNASACEKSSGAGEGADPVRVTVTNQFSSDFTVDEIRWNDSAQPGNNTQKKFDRTLQPGESARFDPNFGDEEVTVVVSGDLDATVTVPVDGRCNVNNVNNSSKGNNSNSDNNGDNGN